MDELMRASTVAVIQQLLSCSYSSGAEAAADICRLLRTTLDVDLVYAAAVAGDELVILAAHDGLNCGLAAGHHLPLDQTLCGRALRSPGPQVAEDLSVGLYADLPARTTLGVGSYAMVPLQDPASGAAVGTLCVLTRDPRPFGDQDLTLLGLMGGILAREQQLECVRAREAGRTAELEEANRRYRALVDDLGDLIVEVDTLGRVTYVNPAVTEMTGMSVDEWAGADMMQHVHPDDQQMAADHLAEMIRAGLTGNPEPPAREARFIVKDGSVRWMTVRGRAIFSEAGDFAGFRGILHDVTVRVEAEQRVRTALTAAEESRDEAEAARDEAQRASRAKSEFLSRMSHELRTPLNAILGFAQLLELDDVGGEDAENVDHILKAGRHLLDLINEVLDVVRIESGRIDLSLEPVNVAEVVAESLDLIRPSAAQRNLRVEAPAKTAQRFVRADRQRLKQVLVNLLSNAVKYNTDAGEILVTCAELSPAETPTAGEEPLWLRLAIRDTGQGINAGQLDDVFTPFERLGAEVTDVEGTGIGLSLTKTLVEVQGGRIGVDSEVGRGSTFWVDLPAAALPLEEDLPEVLGESDTFWTVLYVEDNPANIALMRRILARRSHVRLITVQDGAEAIEVAQQTLPDLVLLDLHLPGMDGAGILTALRGSVDPRLSKVPVVIVTADLSTGCERRMLDAGATLFLPKPLDVGTLLSVVDDYLIPS